MNKQQLLDALQASFTRSDDRDKLFRRNTQATVPSTLDVKSRQAQWVLTTEDPAMVYDWTMGKVVYEVLLMDGVTFEDQTPMLRDHQQYLVTAIIGSVTEVRTVKDELLGLCTFGTQLDDVTEGIWRRVEQGHLRRGSIGYDYGTNDYVTIPAGKTQEVNGRSFTAPADRALRVVFRWRLLEFSMVVIPADPRAQAKNQLPADTTRGTETLVTGHSDSSTSAAQSTDHHLLDEAEMKKYLQFLHKHGLAASVTNETEALQWARSGNLSSALLDEFAVLCKGDSIEFDVASATPKKEAPATTGTRSGSGGTQTQPPTTPPTNVSPETRSAAEIAGEAIANERARINAIRTLGREHSIDPSVVEQAENQGFDINQTRELFLSSLRNRTAPAGPAVHIRSGLNVRVLQAAMLHKMGITPDSAVLNARCVNNIAHRSEFNIGWALHAGQRGNRYDEVCAAFDVVHQQGLQDATLLRFAQELYQLEHRSAAPYNNDELFERVFSSSNFSAVFGATVHISMFAGYESTQKTWMDIVEIDDVADFRDQTDVLDGEVGRLKKQAKATPGEAEVLNISDPVLAKLAAERFAGKLEFSDQTFISDNIGIMGRMPFKVGQMCDGVIADIVFSEVLSTSNLSDSRQRFNTTDGNKITSGTLDVTGLGAADAKLRNVKIGDRRVAFGRTRMLVGTTFAPTARTLQSKESLASNAPNPFVGTFDLTADSAIDIGVSDPRTNPETAIAGRPGSYFLFAQGAGSVKVVFRTGTNRGPISRQYVLDKGKWGRGWDVYVDMGAAFLRRRGAVEVAT